MSKSLQDQLKALGLAKESSPGNRAKQLHKSNPLAPQQQGPAREKHPQSTPKKGRSNSRPAKPASRIAPAEIAAVDLTLEQAYALREQQRKAEEEASKQNKRLEDLKRRQVNNAIKAIVEPHRLNSPDAELARHFMYKGRIRKVNVTLEQFKALNEGELGLVYLSGGYHLLPSARVDEIRALSEEHVPDLSARTEEEEQFPVPDDLIW
jgi:uncharacterized protein YaiL (DUF2058 family)